MKKAIGLILVSCILLFLGGCRGESGERMQDRAELVSAHPSFITEYEWNTVLSTLSQEPAADNGRIVSAVLPHHLVASRLMADAVKAIAVQEPERVIIFGANHQNKGSKVITGWNSWQTPAGVADADETAGRTLVDQGLAVRDEETLSHEHSVGALVPFFKSYLPKMRIVPVILHHDVRLAEVEELLNALEPFADEKTVVIASVDFSHYLTRSEAQVKDQETIIHMQNFDYPTLFRLGNDYLDSPASLAAAFRFAEKKGIKEFLVLDNTNSGIILQNDYIPTTSYFTLLFTQPSH